MTDEQLMEGERLSGKIQSNIDIINQLKYFKNDLKNHNYQVAIREGNAFSWKTLPYSPGKRLDEFIDRLITDCTTELNKCRKEFEKL